MEFGRAVTSGALVAAITVGIGMMTGAGANYNVAAMDGGVMAASVLAADAVSISQFTPPILSPSIVAGAVYAGGLRLVRGDTAYLMNGAVGFTADYITNSIM
jgi:hypothetical protein